MVISKVGINNDFSWLNVVISISRLAKIIAVSDLYPLKRNCSMIKKMGMSTLYAKACLNK